MLPRAIPLLALLAAGCSHVPLLTPHKIDIQQGNVVTQEMVGRLRQGMTRSQVRFTLGTPLVVDPFRADRWDYVYLYARQGVVMEQRRIMVVFKDDKFERFEGDIIPLWRNGATQGGLTGDKPPAAPGGTPDKI